MITKNYITFILLAVIGLVFLFDYLIKRKEDSLLNKDISVISFEKISSNKHIFLKSFFLLLVPIFFIIFLLELFGSGHLVLSESFFDWFFVEFYFDYYVLSTSSFDQNYQSSTFYHFFLPMYVLFSFCISCLKSCNVNFFNFFIKRKKNLSLSLILIPFLKVLIHYFWFPKTKEIVVNAIPNEKYGLTKIEEEISETFGYHLDSVFNDRLELFIPVTIVFLVIVWFFNDKIKAR